MLPPDEPKAFAVFGDPVAHSRSPAMHNAAFAELGESHGYYRCHVDAGTLEPALRGAAALGFGGVNLTTPHKLDAVGIVDVLAPEAARIGAVNTVEFTPDGMVGHNTDGRGFVAGLAELLHGDPHRPAPNLHVATVLGSGGAGRAIVDALAHAFPDARIDWVSRSPDQLPKVAANVRPCGYEGMPSLSGELLVNASRVGLEGGPTSFPVTPALGGLHPDAAVVDIVYPRPPGGLLDQAEAQGRRVQDGRAMLLWQGVLALETWLQSSIPETVVAAMREALDEALR